MGKGAVAEAPVEQTDDVQAMITKPISVTRELLIGKIPRPMRTKDITIPEFGRARVRALKANERESLDDAALKTDATGRVNTDYRMYKARAVAIALVDPDTNLPVFQNPLGEAALLGDLDATILDQLFFAVDELSALTRRQQELLGKEYQQRATGNTSSS